MGLVHTPTVLKRCSATLAAIGVGLLLFILGLTSIEHRGVVPDMPNWFVAVLFLPTLVTDSARGNFSLLISLYLLQCALVGDLVDGVRAVVRKREGPLIR